MRRKLWLFLPPILLLLVGSIFYLRGGRWVNTDNAYLKADKVIISVEVAGTVAAVPTQENQVVAAGQTLFRLDEAPFQLAIAEATAEVAKVRTDLAVLKASYREKQAEIALAKTNYDYALKERQRQQDLVQQGFVSKAKWDEAQLNAELAQHRLATLERDLQKIAESLGGSVTIPIEQHPTYLATQALLDKATLNLARTNIKAQITGRVSKLPKLGQYLAPGNPALVLVSNQDLWIEANFIETDLTRVRPGLPAKIYFDIYPDQLWSGEVESLSPATGAEFSVLPPQNATGNWVKITQRVPVRIRLHSEQPIPPDHIDRQNTLPPPMDNASPNLFPLRAGLSAMVEIDTGYQRTLWRWSLPPWLAN